MAKETKTTVVEAEVTEVKKPRAKRTTRKSPVRTRRALDEISEEAEAELTSGSTSLKRVDESGEINTSNLTPARKAYYKEIASVLNEKEMSTITSYGSDLQRAMSSYSSDFLKQSFDSKAGIESAQLISNLLGELHEVDINDLEAPNAVKRFLRRIPAT